MILDTLITTVLCGALVRAATIQYEWNITRLYANPDGAYNKPTMGINGQWPLPVVNVTKGDRLVIHVNNQLGNESTSLHFHGLHQNGTNSMDGPAGVTQCGIPPGSSFTYNFTADQVGTYWYHSHQRGQYPDGLRGPFIIHDPESPFADQHDEEIVLTLSDWYHDNMPSLIESFISVTNPSGAEPVPDAALMNDSQNITLSVRPGKTYLFHIVNMGAFASQYFWFEGHSMRVVEVDGVYTEEAETDMLYLTVAQRYSVLVTMTNDTSTNYAIIGSMDTDLFDAIPPALNPNSTSYLLYNSTSSLPTPALLDEFSPFDDMALTPLDHAPLLPEPDQVLELTMAMDNLGDGANYAFFNDVTYVPPVVPTLYTALTSPPNLATNVSIYGTSTNSFILAHKQIVEIRLTNADPGKHPFHLHGHAFQVILRADEEAGAYFYDEAVNGSLPATPMRRDTLLVHPNSYFAIRFQSDNPGVWLFHCHIEWHTVSGLVATLIEAPLELQQQSISPEHLKVCKQGGVAYEGNAAGNDVDFLDLSGENIPPGPLSAGFTPRGIVALVFSCVSAAAGTGMVAWYGWPSGGGELR